MTELDSMQAVPLALGKDGIIRFSGSRVTLDSVVHEFQRGATAEQIQEDFPSLKLQQIYGAIAYYLDNTRSVEAYLRAQKQAAARTRRELDKDRNSDDLRERLRRRRTQMAR